MIFKKQKIIIFLALAVIFSFFIFSDLALAQAVNSDTLGNRFAGQIGLGGQDIRTTIAGIIRTALGLLGIVVVVLMIAAGFIWMTAGGNEDKIAQAKKILINSVIGLAIILSAYAITSFIISKLTSATLNLPAHCSNGVKDVDDPATPNNEAEDNIDCGGECLTCAGACVGEECGSSFYRSFYINSAFGGGDVCVRNFHPTITFTQDVNLGTVSTDVFYITNDSDATESKVAGSWRLLPGRNNIIEFIPAGACDGAGSGADCLEAVTNYTFHTETTLVSRIKSVAGTSLSCSFNDNCNQITFTTGAKVDADAPVIVVRSPRGDMEKGSSVPVVMDYTDDSGIQNIAVYDNTRYVDSVRPAAGHNCDLSGSLQVNWNTAGSSLGLHTISADGTDWSGKVGNGTSVVDLRGAECYAEPPVCGGSCGRCANENCTRDTDCASGFCDLDLTPPRCVDKMRITGFGPKSGAPGTFVTLVGRFFGTSLGQVYFTSTTKPQPDVNLASDWVLAPMADCGSASMWNARQITVKVPPEATDGPLKVVTAIGGGRVFTDVTNDDWGPNVGGFDVNNEVHPKLCEIVPSQGIIGDAVELRGRDLQLEDNHVFDATKDQVLFGEIVPNNIQSADWTIERIGTSVPGGLSTGIFAVKVNAKIGGAVRESNALGFTVTQGVNNTLPFIDNIAPEHGAAGEYITITGNNFGTGVGTVWFKLNGAGNATNGDMTFPAECDVPLWTNEKILVKFPPGLDVGDYTVEVKRATDQSVSPIYTKRFKLEVGNPAPGICMLSPADSALPLPAGQYITIFGEYLKPEGASNPEVHFAKSGSTADVATMSSANFVAFYQLGLGQKVEVTPRTDTVSGSVVVRRPGDQKISNALKFGAVSCIENNNTCTDPNVRCCADGTCQARCQGERLNAGYIWRFSTREILEVPQVVEECSDVRGSNGVLAIPSPTPSTMWNTASPVNSDNSEVCSTALITVKFNTAIKQESLANNVFVRQCAVANADGSGCASYTGTNVPLTAESLNLQVASTNNKGIPKNYLLLESANQWQANTWYQVVLTRLITNDNVALGSTVPVQLAADQPCDIGTPDSSAYCFVFKTDDRPCELESLLISPESFLTNTLTGVTGPIRYKVGGNFQDLKYRGLGQSTQRCILMSMRGFEWKWRILKNGSTVDTNYAQIYGNDAQAIARVSSLENTVGVAELTNPTDKVNVEGKAISPSAFPMSATSPLTIDLSNPEVVDYWPKCQEACTNAEIGIRFNVGISRKNLSGAMIGDSPIQLWRCDDVNCLHPAFVTVPTSTIGLPEESENYTVARINIALDKNLEADTWYQVVVATSTMETGQVWSLNSTRDLLVGRKRLEQGLTWRFKTKKEACLIERVAVDPSEYVSESINDRVVYNGRVFSAPDSCSATGQILNPRSVSWAWRSNHPEVAEAYQFNTTNQPNKNCTNYCLRRGSDLPKTSTMPLCGNTIVEAGEDCDPSNKNSGCSLNCLKVGNSNIGTGASQCGNGRVDATAGEECDTAINRSLGCSDSCLRIGSLTKDKVIAENANASVCGDGNVTLGEDCDTGISSVGCSATCLHTGTTLSAEWCRHASDVAGGIYLGYTTNEYNTLCNNTLSKCGDTVQSDNEGEGCEGAARGVVSENCDDFCLKTSGNVCAANTAGCTPNGTLRGSSLFYTVPSVCGDGGTAGIGEDPFCETGLGARSGGDPKVFVAGRGMGTNLVAGQPPKQVADIIGTVSDARKVKNPPVTGSGQFIIPCGKTSDEQCVLATGNADSVVGSNSCCYTRAHLVSVYPATTTPPNLIDGICPNTYLEAAFDLPIDEKTLSGNFLIAKGIENHANGTLSVKPVVAMGISGHTLFSLVHDSDLITTLTASDISNPSSPRELGSISSNAEEIKMARAKLLSVDDKYAYVLGDAYLEIIDISDPEHLVHKANLQLLYDGQSSGLSKILNVGDKKYLFVLVNKTSDNNFGSLHVVDVTNPMVVNTMKSIYNNDGSFVLNNPKAIGISGNNLFVGLGVGGVEVLNISDPTNPGHIGIVALPGSISSISIVGNYLYALSKDEQNFYNVNISNPSAPRLIGSLNNSAIGLVAGIDVSGKIVYLATESADGNVGSVERINIASSTHPLLLTSLGRGSESSGGISSIKFYNDFIISGSKNALNFTYGPNYCEGSEDVTSLVMANIVEQNFQPWYVQIFTKTFAWLRGLIFGDVSAGARAARSFKWCAGSDLGTAKVINDPVKKISRVVVNLDDALVGNTEYAIILKDGINDARGISIGNQAGKSINWKFATAAEICEIDKITVRPAQYLFSKANQAADLQTTVFSANGQMVQATASYDWDYVWSPIQNGIVSWTETREASNRVTSGSINGDVTVRVSANVTVAPSAEKRGRVATAESKLSVNLCENAWPPKSKIMSSGVDAIIWPYEDKINNNDNYDINTRDFTNTPSTDARGYYNFSTSYCADGGASDNVYDDLPYLQPAVQTSASALGGIETKKCAHQDKGCINDGDCGDYVVPYMPYQIVLRGETQTETWEGTSGNPDTDVCAKVLVSDIACIYPDASVCPAEYPFCIGNECKAFEFKTGEPDLIPCDAGRSFYDTQKSFIRTIKVTASRYPKYLPDTCVVTQTSFDKALKRIIFTNDKNSDAIGLQVFQNPQHLSLNDWYDSQNLGGNLGAVQVAGYNALADNNNIYVDAVNIVNGVPHTNVYLFSINSDAKPETRQVFQNVIKNLKFNINAENRRYCSGNSEINCQNDFDCPSGQTCYALIDKMKRNFQRLRDLHNIKVNMDNYSAAGRETPYPNLAEGSLLTGQSISTWPSWSAALSNAVGMGLPSDPINRLGVAGTCTATAGKNVYCLSDSDCGSVLPALNPATCNFHDATTGWSTFERRFSYACATNSSAYRYLYDTTSKTYAVRTKMESTVEIAGDTPDMEWSIPDASWITLKNQLDTPFTLDGHYSFFDASGICNATDPASSVRGEVVTIAESSCGDGIVQAGKEACDPPGSINYGQCVLENNTKMNKMICGANCQWGAPVVVSCLSRCGNAKLEAGEQCDLGTTLNNKIGSTCDSSCRLVGNLCSNGSIDRNEFCDWGEGLFNARSPYFSQQPGVCTNGDGKNERLCSVVDGDAGCKVCKKQPSSFCNASIDCPQLDQGICDTSARNTCNSNADCGICTTKPTISCKINGDCPTVLPGRCAKDNTKVCRKSSDCKVCEESNSFCNDYTNCPAPSSRGSGFCSISNVNCSVNNPCGTSGKFGIENVCIYRQRCVAKAVESQCNLSADVCIIPVQSGRGCVKTDSCVTVAGSCKQSVEFVKKSSPFSIINTDLKMKYSVSKAGSCNWDCKTTGPYCGDEIVQSEFGEECDVANEQTCSIGNIPGKKICGGDCKYRNNVAPYWWKFDLFAVAGNAVNSSVFRRTMPFGELICSGLACPSVVNSGKIGKAFSFDGVKNYLNIYCYNTARGGRKIINSDGRMLTSNRFTVEAWIKPENVENNKILTIVSKGDGDNKNYELTYRKTTDAIKKIYFGIGGSQNIVNVSNLNDQWIHVAGTYDEGNSRVYINGEYKNGTAVEESLFNNNVSFDNFYVGVAHYNTPGSEFANYFKGKIDEVLYYNRVLTPAELKFEYDNGYFCSSTVAQASVATAVSNEPRCGDANVDPGEACDKGDGQNGIVCSAAYNKPCTYCASDCKNILEVKPNQYCGDGIIQVDLGELCETDPNDRSVWAASANTTQSSPPDPLRILTSADNDVPHNGYRVDSCEDYNTANPTFALYLSGTRSCVDCSLLVNGCVQCGLVQADKGVSVSSTIVNALSPAPNNLNPLNFSAGSPPSAPLKIYASATKIANNAPSAVSAFAILTGMHKVDFVDPIHASNVAYLNPSEVCQKPNTDFNYKMVIKGDTAHAFNFPISGANVPGQYDLVISPVMNKAQETDNIRVVAIWYGKNDFMDLSDESGFVRNVFSGGIAGAPRLVAEGAAFSSYISNVIEYYNVPSYAGIWSHGFGDALSPTYVESYTINTNDIPQDVAFYIRSNSPIKNESGYVRVEVYLPSTDLNNDHFDRPSATYYLSEAVSSENDYANYWHVLNIKKKTGVAGDTVQSRLVEINQIRTSPQFFEFR